VSLLGLFVVPAPPQTGLSIALGSQNAQGDRRIVTTVTSRILAMATVGIWNASAASTGPIDVNCRLFLGASVIPMGESSVMTVPHFDRHTLAIEGARVMGAGTYDVLVGCSTSPAAGLFERANLIVWAVPIEE
jgi:hypothetical protein